MSISFNNPTSYSAISSLGVHLIVVVFAGNYILLQDRLIPPPNKTYKLEVVKKSKPPLVKKKPIKKTVGKRVNQAVPVKPKALPQAHTPTRVLTVAQVARDVPKKPVKSAPLHNSSTVSKQSFVKSSAASSSVRSTNVQLKSTPLHNSSTVSKQSFVKSSAASSSFRTASVSPRSAQSVMVSNQSKTGKSVAVSTNPMPRAHSAPVRKMTQTTVTASFASKGGSLIQSSSQRIAAPSFQARMIQSDGISQEVHKKGGASKVETSAVRISSIFGPRSVPKIVDQGALRGYSRSIQRKIAARKKYPRKAKRRGEEGQVIVQFILLKSGRIKNLSLVSATPYAELNEAALEAVRRAAPFSSFPDEIGEEFLELELPFRFEIKK